MDRGKPKRTQMARRSSSADARPFVGPSAARPNRSSVRSAWPPAAGALGSRRSRSAGGMDCRLSQMAQRPARVKDARPFTNKAFLAESVEQLYAFLKEQHYPHSTTPKLLTKMSSKDFQDIFRFLMKFLEPKFQLGKGVRMEDAVFESLRNLRYPYLVQKSTLKSIGSQPHKALAITTWLADVIQYFKTTPMKHFFGRAPPTESLGVPADCSYLGALLSYSLEAKGEENDDRFLDGLLQDSYGPVEPVAVMEKKLAQQKAELQRLKALVEEQDYLERLLECEKLKIQDFEQYFSAIALGVEEKEAQVQMNTEAIKAINAEKDKLTKELVKLQALLKAQHDRHEDLKTYRQEEQRLQQSLSAVQCDIEGLKKQENQLSLAWFNTLQELRVANSKVQTRFKAVVAPLRDVLPQSVLNDLEVRPVEDSWSLVQHQVRHRTAMAMANGMVEQTEADLERSIREEQRLCKQYALMATSLQEELHEKEELITKKRESYFALESADTCEQAQEPDKEYTELSERYADLQLKTMSVSDEQAKAISDARKRLSEAKKRLADAKAQHEDTMAASDEEVKQVEQAVKACYDEHIGLMNQCHSKVIEAIKELSDMKENGLQIQEDGRSGKDGKNVH